MPNTAHLEIHGLSIHIIRKRVKHVYLRVTRPSGQIQVTVPWHATNAFIHNAIDEKLEWLQKKQAQISDLDRAFDSETMLLFLGQRVSMQIIASNKPRVSLQNPSLVHLHLPHNYKLAARQRLIQHWYRIQLRLLLAAFMKKWERIIKVKADSWGVKLMKARWGSCNISLKRIWFNSDLVKTNIHCIEYVVVHELVHLLESSHNARFKALMDSFLPNWRDRRHQLNHALI